MTVSSREKVVTNKQFLDAAFGEQAPEAWVAGLDGDPRSNDPTTRAQWRGTRYGYGGDKLLSPNRSTYYCVSTLEPDKDGKYARNNMQVKQLHVLGIDDVGTGPGAKLTPESVEKLFEDKFGEYVPPSCILETSNGSFHYLYFFKKPFEGNSLALLADYAWQQFFGKKNDAKSPVRYLRMPVGINGKPKHKGFKTRVVKFDPKRKYDPIKFLTQVLGVSKEDVDKAQQGEYVAGTSRQTQGATYDNPEDDPSGWGTVLNEHGLLRSNPKSGVWDVECPNIEAHTQRDDSGCAYLGDGHFKCWHDHCECEPDSLFWDKLEEQYPGITDEVHAVKLEKAKAQFGKDTGHAQNMLEATPGPVVPQWVHQMNDKYALVFTGTQYTALRVRSLTHPDPRKGLTFLRVDDRGLHMEFANDMVQVGVKANGNPAYEVKSKAWVKHPARKDYTSMGMWPPGTEPVGALNLYGGFALAPTPGDWSELRWFMEHVLCDGDTALLEWLLDLLAYKFQNPLARAGVCPIFRGKMRTGKTFFASFIRRFFGWHGAAITRKDDVLGSFNAPMHGKLMLELSEATFAGDRSIAGPLKALVTDEDVRITYKGVDTLFEANRLLVIMTTNENWAVPKELGDTRYPVFNVSDIKRANMAYFAKLGEHLGMWPRGVDRPGFQHADRGAAAFLHDMLQRDVSQFNPEGSPATVGGVEQLLETLRGPARWWAEVLMSGEPPHSVFHSTNFPEVTADDWRKGQVHLPRGSMHKAYNNWVEKVNKASTFHHKEQGFSAPTGFYKALTNAAGTAPTGLPYKRGRVRFGQQLENTDRLLSLDDCRRAFAAASGQHRGDMDVWGWE